MFISSQRPAASVELNASKINTSSIKQTLKPRNIAFSIGTALLTPAMAVGTLIFSDKQDTAYSTQPYRSEFAPVK